MKLERLDGDDPRDVLRALRQAMNGSGPALGLGLIGADERVVAAGTAAVIATSGSSGVPKRVVLSRSALIASAMATSARVGDGAWLLALPAGYVAGLQVLVRSLVAGREPAVVSGAFSPKAFAAAANTMASTDRGERVLTFTSLVPAQLARLLDADDRAVDAAVRSFEAILVGGQAMAPVLLERAADAGVRVIRTYGATETCGGCVYDGRPLHTAAARVVDTEVQVSGPMLADGYLDDQALTASAFVRDAAGTRWYRTGDAGLIDDGILRVRGRLDNVIVSGGVNISLDRVETVVQALPGLESAVVIGVADARWGEACVVVIARGEALRRSQSLQLAQARRAVTAAIGAHARPVRLVLVDDVARLHSGKPDREAIRRAVAELS